MKFQMIQFATAQTIPGKGGEADRVFPERDKVKASLVRVEGLDGQYLALTSEKGETTFIPREQCTFIPVAGTKFYLDHSGPGVILREGAEPTPAVEMKVEVKRK